MTSDRFFHSFRISGMLGGLLTLLLASCQSPKSDGQQSVISGVDTMQADFEQFTEKYAFDKKFRSCTAETEKQYVYDIMQEAYLYNEDVEPNVDLDSFDNAEAVLNSVRSKDDKFSFISDLQQTSNFNQGRGFGYGMVLWVEDDMNNNLGHLVVRNVFSQSSAGRAGLKRGDRIVKLDNEHIFLMDQQTILSRLRKRPGENLKVTIVPVDSSLPLRDHILTSGQFTMETVNALKILTTDKGKKVAYLSLLSFLESTQAELLDAFQGIGQENIDEFVLDLRYNTGGVVTVALLLASLLAQDQGMGKDFARLEFNSNNTEYNSSVPFLVARNPAFSLKRLYVLTTGLTCSASELVMNSLAPLGMDVIQIGDTTCGKPVGSIALEFCDYSFSPISLKFVNGNGDADYDNGFTPDYLGIDVPVHDFGDSRDSLLSMALEHMEFGFVTGMRSAAARKRGPDSTDSGRKNPVLHISDIVF